MRQWALLLVAGWSMAQAGGAWAAECRCDDYKLNGQIEELEKLQARVRAADSQFFDEAGKLLGETGRFLPDLQQALKRGRAKWRFSGAQAVAEGVAVIASAGLGAAMGGGPGGQVHGMLSTMGEMELSEADHVYQMVNKKNLSSDARSMLLQAMQRIKRHLQAMADHEDDLLFALDKMEEIAKALQKCSRCVIQRRRFNEPLNVDPNHADNRFFQRIKGRNGATPPCDMCADIQALFDYIDGMRAMFRARKALLNALVQSQKTIVSLYLEALKVVGRDRWSETLAGRVGDLVTTGLAMGSGGVGGVVKFGFSKLFDYLESKAVESGLKGLLGDIRERQRTHMKMAGWLAPGGEWDQARHALDNSLWQLIRYRYGKCEACERKQDKSLKRARSPRMPRTSSHVSEHPLPGGGEPVLPGETGGALPGEGGLPGGGGGQVCIPGAASLDLPIIRDMPASESAGARVREAGKNVLGGLLGGGSGMFGGGGGPFGGGGKGGARMVNKPKGPWDTLRRGDTGVELAGWKFIPRRSKRPPVIRIALGVKDSPFQGTPDSVWLQDANGNILRPVGYMIYGIWIHWRLTITITREHYINGRLVSRTVTRESTQWKELLERYSVLLTAPSIWERLKARPFGKLRGVIVEFPLPEGFDPARWSLVAHVTAKETMNGKEVIKTVPFVSDLVRGEGKRLRFRPAQEGRSAYQREHPSCGGRSFDAIREMYQRDAFDADAWQSRISEHAGNAGQERTTRKPAGRKPPRLSRHKVNKVKMDAAHWGRIVVLQRQPLAWLKRFHALEREQQRLAAVFMADLALRMFTNNALNVDAMLKAQNEHWRGKMGEAVRNLAIEAASRWGKSLDAGQRRKLADVYRRLSPDLRRVFAREFVGTLGMNLFLDLRMPKPAAY